MTNTFSRHLRRLTLLLIPPLISLAQPAQGWPIASGNVALDSPIYGYLAKLSGFGLITTDVAALRPFAKAEAARLVLEAEENLENLDGEGRIFASEIISRLEDLLSREISLRKGKKAPWFDYNPGPAARLRYLYLDGVPRS